MNLDQSSWLITKNQRRNCQQLYFIFKEYIYGTSSILSSEEKSTEKNESEVSSIDDISEPTNCCMSGCANCVWIQYAEKLSATLEKSVQKLIMDKVQDPNMKAFLSMELRFRNIIKD